MRSSPLLFSALSLCALLLSIACTPELPDDAGITGGGPVIMGLSVSELQAAMARGELSSVTITQSCLARIKEFDGELHAVIAINPDAIEMARSLDRERRNGQLRSPLHGIPVLLKDNIETRDPLPTTAGSLALAHNETGRDAAVAAQLREAGAVLLGKSNLSEWANFRSERSSSGWSGVGGQTHNPYDSTRTPCGSSSGSGVAVAANLVPLALGTETNGSIVCPAAVNGIVGIKPTVGLVSRRGIVPISHSQDTAGPMARSVADAVTLLSAMIDSDEKDPATYIASAASKWTLTNHLLPDGLRGKRIGILRSQAGYHDGVDRLFEVAIADLQAAGAILVDDLAFEATPDFEKAIYDLLLYEFKHDLNAYLAKLPDPTLSKLTLERLITFNNEHASEEMLYFGQEIFTKSQVMGPLSDARYRDALTLALRTTREQGIDHLVEQHELDALVAPTGSPAWKIDLINGDHFLGGSSTYPAVAGYPNITVPMGQVSGMPVGLSFFGPALSEATLIEIAFSYEQATHHQTPPEL